MTRLMWWSGSSLRLLLSKPNPISSTLAKTCSHKYQITVGHAGHFAMDRHTWIIKWVGST
ncbi:hypothetical protein P170DRAFT_438877 [Aspergillus steynii IBT 23096]|uniref:Uncharacterized protein n=1 Tax=Aspergillus steynii IBT 23096 TaxID=1392250 RepID=A0A2I2G2R1_9EURO|nr:uncharacterized protein P170DRAFT_438877 [Aspergillus steynii IBT 23096]PLB47173.1 hypothetical protein P170DRAFT_438877 [Aspergillus steynii IBT 23096]